MKTKIIFAVTVMSFCFFSCKKNNSSSSGYNYKLTTANRSSTITVAESGNLLWNAGFVNANLLKFEAKNSGGSEVEYKSNVSQKIDLFAPSASQVGKVQLPAGTYSEIEFKAELAPNGNDPALELSGTFTDASGSVPVMFVVNTPLEIKTEDNTATVNDNTSYSALTTLNLNMLTGNVTSAMLSAASQTNGQIIISADSNANIYNLILSNFDGCDEVSFEHD